MRSPCWTAMPYSLTLLYSWITPNTTWFCKTYGPYLIKCASLLSYRSRTKLLYNVGGLDTKSCPTLETPWTAACQASSGHGILQARILEWVAISFSRESYQPRDWTWVSFIAVRFFTYWATRKALLQCYTMLYIQSYTVFSSVAQSGLTLCDPMNRSTPGLPVHHQLPEFTQTHVRRVGDAI